MATSETSHLPNGTSDINTPCTSQAQWAGRVGWHFVSPDNIQVFGLSKDGGQEFAFDSWNKVRAIYYMQTDLFPWITASCSYVAVIYPNPVCDYELYVIWWIAKFSAFIQAKEQMFVKNRYICLLLHTMYRIHSHFIQIMTNVLLTFISKIGRK